MSGTEKQEIKHIYIFPNGMVAVTDQNDEQIPEYQGKYEDVWPKILEDMPTKAVVHWATSEMAKSDDSKSTITPALDAAIQDEIEHRPKSIMKEE